jgi:two-component system, NtrC family, sensor kinase
MEPRDKLEETMVLGEGGRAERALAQLASLPPDGDLEDGLYAIVSTFAEGADDLFIGVCVPNVDGRQLVVRHAPRPSQPRINDAARLFPEIDDEVVLDLPLDPGSTLHVAGDSLAFYRDHEALALALGSLVRRWRFVLELRRDAGEVHSLRDKAVQSDKLAGLGRMAASIVHELNNPLTSIVAYADYLQKRWEEGQPDPADRERLARISEAAARVLSFTRDLVAYSRPSSAEPTLLNLHDVLERAMQFCEHVLESNHVTVERSYADIPPIRGLHGPLTQVFVNLVTNACQAMPQGGVLTLGTSVDTDERMVEVAVADEGHGIPVEHVDKLFEAYVTTRGDGGGSGLGLNIVRTIVHSHGGTVCAKNRTPSGSVFVIRLPYRAR